MRLTKQERARVRAAVEEMFSVPFRVDGREYMAGVTETVKSSKLFVFAVLWRPYNAR